MDTQMTNIPTASPSPLKALFRSRKFLLALAGVAQSILFQFVPGFPPTVWQSIDIMIVALITTIAVEDAARKLGTKGAR